MRIHSLFSRCLLAAFLFSNSSCAPEEPEIPNEEELITTVKIALVSSSGADSLEISFQDLDGNGGNPPIIAGGFLDTNTTYEATVTLFNEAATPVENITTEIMEEDEEHQFFYQTDVAGLGITYSDADANGKPIGLATSITTSSAGLGGLTLTLRHEPNKSAPGVASGDISNAGGETDIEISFPIEVQ